MVQLIDEPPRVTESSATTIDLILTNRPEYVSYSGVIHIGISDHSLITVVRKFTTPKYVACAKEARNLKNFSEKDFLFDLS